MALVTIQEIKDYLQITSDVSVTTDANLGSLANYASAVIEGYCGREFASQLVTEIHDGGRTSVFVNRLPINNVNLVAEYNGVQYVPLQGPVTFTGERSNTVGNSNAVVEYVVDPEIGQVSRDVSFNSGFPNLDINYPPIFKNYAGAVKIEYNGGYDETPQDIKLAALDYIKLLYKQDQGNRAMTFQGETKQKYPLTESDFPPHIKRILDFYRILIA